MYHNWHHFAYPAYHKSRITNHVSQITYHKSRITNHNHKSQSQSQIINNDEDVEDEERRFPALLHGVPCTAGR